MGAPTSYQEVLLGPGMLCFFGLVLWFLGLTSEKNIGKPANWKYVAFLLIAIAFFLSFRFLWDYYNPNTGAFYRAAINKRSVHNSHMIVILVPILTSAIIFVWSLIQKRKNEDNYNF